MYMFVFASANKRIFKYDFKCVCVCVCVCGKQGKSWFTDHEAVQSKRNTYITRGMLPCVYY